MLKRIITSIVSVCILLPILFFSGTIVFPIAVAIVCCIALYEMYKCIGKHKNVALCIPTYLFALASPFLLRYFSAECFKIMFVYTVAFLIYVFILCITSKGKLTFGEIGEFFTVSLYIISAMNAILYIRDLPRGEYIYWLIFVGAWITDIFAYFVGVFFGKHKLIPDVSPKKTVEGSIGGTLFCVASFVLFGFLARIYAENTHDWIYVNYILLAVCGLVAAIASQVGDLIMSVIKRHYGIKDYGKIFPGHGGVLDRFDSILAVSIIICALCVFSQVTGITMIGGGIE